MQTSEITLLAFVISIFFLLLWDRHKLIHSMETLEENYEELVKFIKFVYQKDKKKD